MVEEITNSRVGNDKDDPFISPFWGFAPTDEFPSPPVTCSCFCCSSISVYLWRGGMATLAAWFKPLEIGCNVAVGMFRSKTAKNWRDGLRILAPFFGCFFFHLGFPPQKKGLIPPAQNRSQRIYDLLNPKGIGLAVPFASSWRMRVRHWRFEDLAQEIPKAQEKQVQTGLKNTSITWCCSR